jgi:hypothetical protein
MPLRKEQIAHGDVPFANDLLLEIDVLLLPAVERSARPIKLHGDGAKKFGKRPLAPITCRAENLELSFAFARDLLGDACQPAVKKRSEKSGRNSTGHDRAEHGREDGLLRVGEDHVRLVTIMPRHSARHLDGARRSFRS